uniref:MYND-type domain-containing protein n=1 Tax=Mantoniella antarctica TaxID=81844 RepID=A0A7S0SM94_9CHLO|mmetsp:Transcript_28778/g.72012  ORF Transcript_28778/g.72012 Transcript_28778/m.72012 type:complete len:335 (+) Transcript_28778:362-1366(+)
MGGKKARGRTDRAKRAAAAAYPPAVPSTAHEPPKSRSCNQQVDASSEATLAAPTQTGAGAERAEYTKLLKFVTGIIDGMERENDSWMASEFAGDIAALAAAAERGDGKAQLAMFHLSHSDEERTKWLSRGGHDYNEMHYFVAMSATYNYLSAVCMQDGPGKTNALLGKDRHMECLLNAAKRCFAAAQYLLGMLIYCSLCDANIKFKPADKVFDSLDAARWVRKAAMQGFAEAQYELGEMFRCGLFCKVHMRFARKYIRRASVQGHVEAIARMKELRSCMLCGGDDAKLACSLCHRARYCDSWCSEKHWCEGGGAAGGPMSRHRDTCPRTHTRGS